MAAFCSYCRYVYCSRGWNEKSRRGKITLFLYDIYDIKNNVEGSMSLAEISGIVGGIISIAFGLLVIVWPRLLRYIVGIYFIIIGVIAIVNAL